MKIVKIDNVDDERLDPFYRYREEQLYKRNIFVGESELIINRALDNGFIPNSFLITQNDESKYQDIFNRVKEDCILYEVSEEVFKKIKGYALIRGILGVFKRKEELSIEEVLKNNSRIVVLESVVNPTNVGAIFRNVVGLNYDGVILTNDSCDPLSRRSIRTSMGNVFMSRWTYVDKDNYIDLLNKFGYKTVALALKDNSYDVDDKIIKNEEKLAIILGSEGYGMSDKTISKCDYVVKIDMNPKVDSLNVASASAIALWNLRK